MGAEKPRQYLAQLVGNDLLLTVEHDEEVPDISGVWRMRKPRRLPEVIVGPYSYPAGMSPDVEERADG